jgi:hypothetical protein
MEMVNWGIEMDRVIEQKFRCADVVTVVRVYRLEWLGL